jgi:Fe-S cluster assembly iron-binding protein IscA
MLQLTEGARLHLRKVRNERHQDDANARFVASPSGEGVSLSFEKEAQQGDRVVHTDGIDVFVAPAVAERLDQSVIDVGKRRDGKAVLTLRPQRRSANG